ncbi:MAG: UDP-glucose 4-epimerase GalE [Pedosphaera sp.]|nr:UDP-glucose 4-epimerase GalE [Pedosphaera sp.]
MRVLVTGGAGYIASVCVDELIRAGHEVVVFDNLSEGHRGAIHSNARLIVGDLGDLEGLHRVFAEVKPQAVIHFAANALVGESMANPGKYYRNNVGGGLNLLEAMVAAGVSKIVFSSTCAVYGIPDTLPITEELPFRPANVYGETKLTFERMLRWYRQIHGISFVAFRYFNAAGARGFFGEHHRIETHLIPNVLKVALGQAKQCEIFGGDYPTPDGTCVRDYIHVSDLAAAHVSALNPDASGYYNLGTGYGFSVREVIAACEKVTGFGILAVLKPRRDGDPPSLVADPSKAKRDLGWQAHFTRIEDIVQTAWDWHRQHPTGYSD